jgi:hypothetical protein
MHAPVEENVPERMGRDDHVRLVSSRLILCKRFAEEAAGPCTLCLILVYVLVCGAIFTAR